MAQSYGAALLLAAFASRTENEAPGGYVRGLVPRVDLADAESPRLLRRRRQQRG